MGIERKTTLAPRLPNALWKYKESFCSFYVWFDLLVAK